MKRYLIRLSYNGKNYHGWQIQDNAHTVQAEINEKLSILLKKDINVVGCGRTDTGVHASEFFAHFDVSDEIEVPEEISFKLDKFLPPDIHIADVFKVDNDFHSRFDADARTYAYYISTVKNPFASELSYFYRGPLNVDAMNASCDYLFQHTDFTSFSKLHSQTKTNICKIEEAVWKKNNGQLVFTITADRFLRNMVRAIVGTMVEIGKGKLKPEDMLKIIEAKDRSKAGFSVPAQGLFLEKVTYHKLLVK